MLRRGQYDFAASFAEKLLHEEFGINKLPINPIAIAKSRGITVHPMDDCDEGVSGMFIHAYGKFAIAYATHIKNKGFQNFSIAHELGHCFLPGHIDAVLPAGESCHQSKAHFMSNDKYELEADHFAAGLLMPARLFRAAMQTAGEGLDAVEILKERCDTSLTATAIRLRQLTDEAMAVVQSKDGRIEFCTVSDRMRRLKPARWPLKGTALPRASAAAKLSARPDDVAAGERVSGETEGSDWFGELAIDELFEESVGLGNYGRILTMLTTVDDLPDDEDGHDAEGAWQPSFGRK